jgi:hypothetical protein
LSCGSPQATFFSASSAVNLNKFGKKKGWRVNAPAFLVNVENLIRFPMPTEYTLSESAYRW